ncbi:MAG: stage II sporulation protein R [Eubacterium sp.]|nr:stage II sporulation protein R [Eubacterium sp.]
MRKIIVIAWIGIMTLGLIWSGRSQWAKGRQQEIAGEIIRLHVIANSDSDGDQQLKLAVKEEIVTYLREKIQTTTDKAQAREILSQELPEIERRATDFMQKKGYSYTATAELGNCYFPVKQYGDMTFPAGEYEALRVKIGESKGKNWWCVMYPSLCLVDGVCETVPEESKRKLQGVLSEENYDSLLEENQDVTYSSKIAQWVSELWN